MAYRVTPAMLDRYVEQVNSLLGKPATGWTRTDTDFVANVGHYQLDRAYGGVGLVQLVSDGVAETCIIQRTTSRGMLDCLQAMIYGIKEAQK